MPRLPRISGEQAIAVGERLGFRMDGWQMNSSHRFFVPAILIATATTMLSMATVDTPIA